VTVLKTVFGSSTVCFAAGEEEVGGADGLCRKVKKCKSRKWMRNKSKPN
jgi:hypothetical protein